MNTLIFISIVLGIIFIGGIIIYNRLVARKNLALEAWSGIDVQLKRRYDLLPKLVDTVKAYSQYEQQALAQIIQLRNSANSTMLQRADIENSISNSLSKLFALAENYPELKANQSYLDLQKQISETEEQIQYARRYYNGAVRDLNILIESFPSNLIAQFFKYAKLDYFEISLATQHESPELKL